jgi:RNA polymerase sigma factor (sigma-70 family)
MAGETDASLVTYMAFYPEERAAAEAAAAELFRRHSGKMTAWCAKSFWLFRQNHEELVHSTFLKALKGAGAFATRLEKVPAENRTKQIKFWLYCILKNICIDARRSEETERNERSGFSIDEVGGEQIALDEADTGSASLPDDHTITLIREFIAALPARDQAIMYNTMQFYDRRSGSTIMPKEILNDLCSELGMTKTSLKTQRFRLLDRLQQHVQARK